MNFLKRLLPKPREIWHYTCINNHTWESFSSPVACYGPYALRTGKEGTRCPQCKTEICKGDVYIDGKFAHMGAIHSGFLSRKRKRK